MFRSLSDFGFIVLVVALAQRPVSGQLPPNGAVLSHNGTAGSTPAGSGDVNVYFGYGNVTYGPVFQQYSETATHVVQYAYADTDEPFFWARSYIFNNSQVSWTQLDVLLHNADFLGWDYDNPTQATATGPAYDIGYGYPVNSGAAANRIGLQHLPSSPFSLAASSITRFNDQGAGFQDALLTITFADPILPGDGFALHYNIVPSPGATDTTGFTASNAAIPEPASLILAALGAVATLARWRRTG